MSGAVVLVLILFCFVMYLITSHFQEKREWRERNNDFLMRGIEKDLSLFEHVNRNNDRKKGKEFYSSPEWRRLRYKALKQYGGACAACGRSAKHGLVMHVDHIKPRSKFPHLALEITNLQIMCEECNLAKSNTDNIKWRS